MTIDIESASGESMGWGDVPIKARYLKLVQNSTSDDPLLQNGNLLLGKEWKLDTPVKAVVLEVSRPYYLEVTKKYTPGVLPLKFASAADAEAEGFGFTIDDAKQVKLAADVTFLVDVGDYDNPDYVFGETGWCRAKYSFTKTSFQAVQPIVNATLITSPEGDPRTTQWELAVSPRKFGPNTWLVVEPKNKGLTSEEMLAWMNETPGLSSFEPIQR